MIATKMNSEEFSRTGLLSQLIDYIASDNDPLIVKNMIDYDTPWSLVNQIKDGRFMSNGFMTVMTDERGIAAISGCERTNQVFVNSINFGIRTWARKDLRASGVLARVTEPHVAWAAQEKLICWASFNESRSSLVRFTMKRKHATDPVVRSVCADFKQLPEPIMVNNVKQWVIYRDFGNSPVFD